MLLTAIPPAAVGRLNDCLTNPILSVLHACPSVFLRWGFFFSSLSFPFSPSSSLNPLSQCRRHLPLEIQACRSLFRLWPAAAEDQSAVCSHVMLASNTKLNGFFVTPGGFCFGTSASSLLLLQISLNDVASLRCDCPRTSLVQ